MREAKRTVQNMHLDILNKPHRCANIQQEADRAAELWVGTTRTEGIMVSRALVLSSIFTFATGLASVGNAGAQQPVNPAEVMSDMLRRELARQPPQPVRPSPPPQEQFDWDPSKYGTPVTKDTPAQTPEQQERIRQFNIRRTLEAEFQEQERQESLQRLREQELRDPPPPPPMSCTTRSLGGGDFTTDCF
jgi:hypothetical protein